MRRVLIWVCGSSTNFSVYSDPVNAVVSSAGVSVALPNRAVLLEACSGRGADGVEGVRSGDHPGASGCPGA